MKTGKWHTFDFLKDTAHGMVNMNIFD